MKDALTSGKNRLNPVAVELYTTSKSTVDSLKARTAMLRKIVLSSSRADKAVDSGFKGQIS